MKTKAAAVFALSGSFYVKVVYDAGFLRQDHEQEQRRAMILHLLRRGVTPAAIKCQAGAIFWTIQWEGQHQTTEKRRREPIVAEAAQSLQNNPRQSMRAMAKDLGMSEGTVHTIVKEDLGCKLFTRPKRHLSSALVQKTGALKGPTSW